MYPSGRSSYPYENSLQDWNNGGGFYPDRYYSHTPGTMRGDTCYTQVYGTPESAANWSYTDNGRYGLFEPYDRRGPNRLRRY
jgi:hypothetical protein